MPVGQGPPFGEVNGLDEIYNLDEDLNNVAPIEELDETLKDKEKEKAQEEQEAADRSVAEAVAELTGEKETMVDTEPILDDEQEAVVRPLSLFWRPQRRIVAQKLVDDMCLFQRMTAEIFNKLETIHHSAHSKVIIIF